MSYRVKHIPTGLYYCRSRDVKVKWTDKNGKLSWTWVKSNLSKKGKIYHEIPASSWYAGSIGNHVHLQQLIQKGLLNPTNIGWNDRSVTAPISDWVVESMDGKPVMTKDDAAYQKAYQDGFKAGFLAGRADYKQQTLDDM